MERPLDCSVAEYGQLALWTGIVGEAPGHAQCPLRGLGMARHSNEGSRQRVGRGGVVGTQMRPTAHGGSRKGVDYPGEPTLNLEEGEGGAGGSVGSPESEIRFRQASNCLVEMVIRKKPLDYM